MNFCMVDGLCQNKLSGVCIIRKEIGTKKKKVLDLTNL